MFMEPERPEPCLQEELATGRCSEPTASIPIFKIISNVTLHVRLDPRRNTFPPGFPNIIWRLPRLSSCYGDRDEVPRRELVTIFLFLPNTTLLPTHDLREGCWTSCENKRKEMSVY